MVSSLKITLSTLLKWTLSIATFAKNSKDPIKIVPLGSFLFAVRPGITESRNSYIRYSMLSI